VVREEEAISMRTPKLVVLAGLVGALGSIGCGGGSAPTDSSEPVLPSARGGSAVLQGTVVGGPGAAARPAEVSALSAPDGLRVSVVGTSIAAAVDSDGQFVLTGLPSGAVTLRFEGPGLDARLTVDGLVEGAVLTLSVLLKEGAAHASAPPVPKPSCDLKWEGRIEAIQGTRLVVDGRQVEVTGKTKIARGDYPGALAELKVGDKVTLWGTLFPDGVVVAYEIVGDGPRFKGSATSFKGVVDSTSPLRVGGIRVRTDGATRFKWSDATALDPSQIVAGDKAYVEGQTQADGSVLATKVMVDCR
jgi:hypothetical protein